MKLDDCKKGMRVKYVPHDKSGVISSINNTYVFVKYDNSGVIMKTGDEPYTAMATAPKDLVEI